MTPQEAPALGKGSQLPEIHRNFNPFQFRDQLLSPSCCGRTWGSWICPCRDHSVNIQRGSSVPAAATGIVKPRWQPHFQGTSVLFFRGTKQLHGPEETQQQVTAKKTRFPFQHPKHRQLPGALYAPHPRDNLFVLQLPSTQLQRTYVEMKMQSHKDASLRG